MNDLAAELTRPKGVHAGPGAVVIQNILDV